MRTLLAPNPSAPPPAFLRLTGHPVRWHLLSELARSDRQVRELTALVDQRQSLTSYHLRELRSGGLVTMRRSSADKRDAYYSLDLAGCRDKLAEAGAALHPGLRPSSVALTPPAGGSPEGPAPTRVLFLCTGNSARSQMAEALLAERGGGRVEVASAGSHPKALHPEAVRVMRERGIDISGRRTKHLSEFSEERFDYVISLCDRVREVCPDFPSAPTVAHWSLADPADEAASDDAGRAAFARVVDELERRLEFLLAAMDHARTSREGA